MKVDVLAVMDAEAKYLNECGIVRGLCPSELERFANLVNARAAIAELIEADKALDAIEAELPCAPEDMPDPMGWIQRRDLAVARRRAALAKVQP